MYFYSSPWTEEEVDVLIQNTKDQMIEVGGLLKSNDWEVVAKKQNQEFAGKIMKKGSKLALVRAKYRKVNPKSSIANDPGNLVKNMRAAVRTASGIRAILRARSDLCGAIIKHLAVMNGVGAGTSSSVISQSEEAHPLILPQLQ